MAVAVAEWLKGGQATWPWAVAVTIGVARIFSRGGTIPDVRLYWKLDYSRTRSVLDPEAGGVWGGAL